MGPKVCYTPCMAEQPHPLADFMRDNRLNQSELARRIGCTPGAVNMWVSGARTMSIGQARKIKRLTGLTLDQLYTRIEA
jgi:plasmid maintenance system antidote protein VapI